jgi:hypothetical protein
VSCQEAAMPVVRNIFLEGGDISVKAMQARGAVF